MSNHFARRILLGSSALLSSIVWIDAAYSQTIQLPQITVNAPSPIQRAPAASDTPLLGTLPIVTDQFATVTVVPRDEIVRSPGTTLGDILSAKPGITNSGFAPGAASRPIVRGLDMHRVRIQENGIGSNGASELGEDHGIPIDPLSVRQVEVIRGPATLRWGSQAIGGVVNADNNRIPTAIPLRGIATELNGAWSSADSGLEGSVLLDAGKGSFALHADAYSRNASDYRVPRNPYLFDPTRPFSGRQANSSLRSDGQAIGGSYLFTGGFAGVSVSQYRSSYHIPTIDGADGNTRIEMKQTKVTGKGEFRPQSSAIDTVRFWFGHTDYKHHEIGLEDPLDPLSMTIHQTFTNKETEARAEAQFAPANLRFGALVTAIGVQMWHQRLTASSPEDPGSILNGLFDPNRTTGIAGYMFNELKFSPTLKAQLAGRVEWNKTSGMALDFPSTVFDISGLSPSTARDRSFVPTSVSFGVIKDLPWQLAASLTAQYVERAPRAPELYSRGVHDATGTFDIGNPNLKTEVAKSVEAGMRRAKGPFRFEVTAYYTRFNGFIYRQLTGAQCNETSCGMAAGDEELNQAIYSQRDALFRGGEVQFQWDLRKVGSGFFGVDGQYDIVRATFTDGSNVPRIPPQRLGGGVYWRNDEWYARVGLLHAFAQNDIGAFERAPTPGYNLLKAELSRTVKLKNDPAGIREVTLGVVGNNLLDAGIRNATSFTKYEVLAPGASARAFASVRF